MLSGSRSLLEIVVLEMTTESDTTAGKITDSTPSSEWIVLTSMQ